MEKQDRILDQAEVVMEQLLGEITAARAPAMKRFAALQGERAARLTKAEDRLKKSLGEDDPRVVTLRAAASSASSLELSLRDAAAREADRPRVGPREWMVLGRVLSSDGKPIDGVRVRVHDREHKYDDLLGETLTDEQGDFMLVYHERDFSEAREIQAELFLSLEDAEGNTLYASPDKLGYAPGRAEAFLIVLDGKTARGPNRQRVRKSGPRA